MNHNRNFRTILPICIGLAALFMLVTLVAAAFLIDIVGPAGSGQFGTTVTVLPNGNIVVTDPYYDAGGIDAVGAVYLYDGATGALISMLTGSTDGDLTAVEVIALDNGNFVVRSPFWDNGLARDAGAVTWGSGTAGISGAVSAANSLVGSTSNDWVGTNGVTVLANSNFVVHSPYWDNGLAIDAGAVTWGSSTSGVSGVVSAANSLVGSTSNDWVGSIGVTALANSNYVVSSPSWDGGVPDAGAVTWSSGTTGIAGTVSAANSLVGSTSNDWVGSIGVTALANSNYVVISRYWDNGAAIDAGAVTWGSGTNGINGAVSDANSLVGSTNDDQVGYSLTALTNGNYVVSNPYWNNGDAVIAGAATWGSGTSGVIGPISAANSLVGTTAGDQVGFWVTTLTNGSYVVRSPYWDNGEVIDAGAVTWGSGTSGVSGPVSAANSLVGSTPGDQVGVSDVTELANGNYVVGSPTWDNGAAVDAGAVTWGSGTSGVSGAVSPANSLVGSSSEDILGYDDVTVLANGNYVVSRPTWDNGAATDAGAVTWGSGTTGVSGAVSAANSLVGSTANDQVGYYGVTLLANGNYVVSSPSWDNDVATDAGAATWGDGTTGISEEISAANSLVGSTAGDQVGSTVTALVNGNYMVSSPLWDNGAVVDAGAATWGRGTTGVIGAVSAANSLVGSTTVNKVGSSGITALTNGNYVVRSVSWDNGAITDAGAITWGNGTTGISGAVSAANSLIGSTSGDNVGFDGVTELANGNFIVSSPSWDNGTAVDAGAVTWGNGTTGITGTICAANSLVGSSTGDKIGYPGVTILANGNYVVSSISWDNGTATDAGAATWGSGTSGISGAVSAANSLVGSTAGDLVGYLATNQGITALATGNYVVRSVLWDNGAAANAGAVTWGSGTSGVSGAVSPANSLVGSTTGDIIGYPGVTILANGDYVVHSPSWDNGVAIDAGAVTLGDGGGSSTGPVSADNSVLGIATGGGLNLNSAYDDTNDQLVVGRPGDNIVTLFRFNLPPEANAGFDQNVQTLSLVTLDGSASSDLDGDLPLAYLWAQSGGPPVSLSDPQIASPTFSAPGDPAVITFTLTVTDSLGLPGQTTDEIVVTVTNQAPQAEAGEDQAVHASNLVTLDGSASSDPDGDLPLGYLWAQSGGPPVSLSDPQVVSPTFSAPGDPAVITFTLMVTDSLGLPDLPPDEIVVTVTNQAPVADAGVDQDVESSALVTLDGSASSDPDGDLPLVYQWTQSGGPPITLSASTTVNPSFIAPATITETVNVTITLVVSDSLGLASSPAQVLITIEPHRLFLPLTSR